MDRVTGLRFLQGPDPIGRENKIASDSMPPSASQVFVLDPSVHNFARALLGLFFLFFKFYPADK